MSLRKWGLALVLLYLSLMGMPLGYTVECKLAPGRDLKPLILEILVSSERKLKPEVRADLLDELKEALKTYPLDELPEDELYNRIGAFFFLQGRLDVSVWAFSKGAEISGRGELVNNLATALVLSNEGELALEVLSALLRENPDYLPAILNVALIYIREKRFDLAKGCIQRARELQPGFLPTESLAKELGRAIGDDSYLTESSLNASLLNPWDKNSELSLRSLDENSLRKEVHRRLRDYKVPGNILDLPEMVEDVETFVLLEEKTGFWKKVLKYSSPMTLGKSAFSYRAPKLIPPDAWNKLSPKSREAMRRAGYRPGEVKELPELKRLREARSHYRFLGNVLADYQIYYSSQFKLSYEKRGVPELINRETMKQTLLLKRYFQKLKSELPRGDSISIESDAEARYLSEALSSVKTTHRRLRRLLNDARRENLMLLNEYLLKGHLALYMVPLSFRSVERREIVKTALLVNYYHSLHIVAWWQTARAPIIFKGRIHTYFPQALENRYSIWENQPEREIEENLEELIDGDLQIPRNLKGWVNVDLWLFSIKYTTQNELTISLGGGSGVPVGMGILGEATYNIDTDKLYIGLGLGSNFEMGPLGLNAKSVYVYEVDFNKPSFRLGYQTQISATASYGSLGAEYNLYDKTFWIIPGD